MLLSSPRFPRENRGQVGRCWVAQARARSGGRGLSAPRLVSRAEAGPAWRRRAGIHRGTWPGGREGTFSWEVEGQEQSARILEDVWGSESDWGQSPG